MPPLTGEPLVIFRQLAWTTEMTGECQWKVCFCLWSHPQIYSGLFSELVNVRGNLCANCTFWTSFSSVYGWTLHIDSWYSSEMGCNFDGKSGRIENEDNFGFYDVFNPAFRCTFSASSTSQLRSGWEVFKFKQQAADESDGLKPNI